LNKTARKALLPAVLVAATMMIGCQMPFQPTAGKPRVVVHVGNLKFEQDAALALVLKFERGQFNAQSLESQGVYRVQVAINSPNLAQPLMAEVTQADFQRGQAVFNFSDLPPGTVNIKVNAFDATGKLLQWANGTAEVVPNQTTTYTLYCNTATGGLQIIYDCPDCPTSAPSSSPSPPASPSPFPTPTLPPTGTNINTVLGMSNPWGIAIDSAGFAWVANRGNHKVSRVAADGTVVSNHDVPSNPIDVAIDANGNVWVTSYNTTNVTKLSPTGERLATYDVGGSTFGIDIDTQGNVWVANAYKDAVYRIRPDGTVDGPFDVDDWPHEVAVDPSGNVWVACAEAGTVVVLDSSGKRITSHSLGGRAIAVEHNAEGDVFVALANRNQIAKFAGGGSSFVTFSSQGTYPNGIAIGLDGNLYITNQLSNNVAKLSSDGTLIANMSPQGISNPGPTGITLDRSGLIWVSNFAASNISVYAP